MDNDSLPQYEFSEEENSVIADLANWLGRVGLFMMALGLLYALAVVMSSIPISAPNSDVEFKISGLMIPLVFIITFGTGIFIFIFTGMALRRGAGRFELIVGSERNDIDHLMAALDELTKVYRVWGILMATGLVLLFASAFVGGGPGGVP